MSWLLPPFDDPGLCQAFQPAWGRGELPSLVLQEAISPAAARRLRGLLRPHLAAFSVPERGRYQEVAAHPALAEVTALLRSYAAAATGLAFAIDAPAVLQTGAARVQRFGPGDYALRWDDWQRRPPGVVLEATLDLSPALCANADTVYSESPILHFSLPQRPGQLGLVLRGEGGSRFDRYLSCAAGRRSAWKLRAAFPLPPPPISPGRSEPLRVRWGGLLP